MNESNHSTFNNIDAVNKSTKRTKLRNINNDVLNMLHAMQIRKHCSVHFVETFVNKITLTELYALSNFLFVS